MYMLHCTVLQLEANWYSCRLCNDIVILSTTGCYLSGDVCKGVGSIELWPMVQSNPHEST
jgi:hypothetical protein